MLKIKFKSKVSKGARCALDKQRFQKVITMGLNEIGSDLVETAKQGITESPKTYKRYYYPGLGYVMSSQPDTYPADQTGNLKRSIESKTIGNKMWFGANDNADYAKYLQQTDSPDATSQWVKIAPRPMLTLSHNENKSRFVDVMTDNFEKMMK